jgi:energy-coupling factor transport system permease protein
MIFLLMTVPRGQLKAGLLPISLFLLFTFISNVINQHGRILMTAGPFMITDEGLNIAMVRTVRLFLMIAGVKLMMARMKTEDIVHAGGRLLSPLEKLGLPIRDFFETMGLTITCFPVLRKMASETYRVKMRTETVHGFWNKTKLISLFLLPMFIKSIQSPETFFRESDTREKES